MAKQAESPKPIDLGDLTEVIMSSVRRALAERVGGGEIPRLPPHRIIVGIILEPHVLQGEVGTESAV